MLRDKRITKESENADRHAFGFWLYLMTDLVIFGVLFAVYMILRDSAFGGPTARELFNLPSALASTLILLVSSFTCGMAAIAAQKDDDERVVKWLIATFVLGGTFLALELNEFSRMVADGAGWTRSAFLSSFFTLVGTHGLHIAIGLLWIAVAIWQVKKRGLTEGIISKLNRFVLFWHFLDVVWIFIFTIVYLMGHLS